MWSSGVFSKITHANHMTMTTSGQILSWLDYRKTKENVNIKLLDVVFVYILLSICQWVQMALAINIPDNLLMEDSDEKRLQNYSCLIKQFMVKVIYNDQIAYKVVIWAFFGISLWTEKVDIKRHIKVKPHTLCTLAEGRALTTTYAVIVSDVYLDN